MGRRRFYSALMRGAGLHVPREDSRRDPPIDQPVERPSDERSGSDAPQIFIDPSGEVFLPGDIIVTDLDDGTASQCSRETSRSLALRVFQYEDRKHIVFAARRSMEARRGRRSSDFDAAELVEERARIFERLVNKERGR